MRRIVPALLLLPVLALASCSSVPAVVKTSRGETFRGTGTSTVVGGTFSLHSSEGLMLNGTVRSWQDRSVFKFDISDGRTGMVPVQKLGEGAGHGVGRIDKGGRVRFMYGDAAIAKYGRSGI